MRKTKPIFAEPPKVSAEEQISAEVESMMEETVLTIMVKMNLTQSIAPHIVKNALNRYAAQI